MSDLEFYLVLFSVLIAFCITTTAAIKNHFEENNSAPKKNNPKPMKYNAKPKKEEFKGMGGTTLTDTAYLITADPTYLRQVPKDQQLFITPVVDYMENELYVFDLTLYNPATDLSIRARCVCGLE
eukprot:TRINITY_DN10049_c0_g1_i1.p1 TRINITY_DN10049_c0_g1~~TRINITY_DN10049_c0_g1_i1.p1  ORF type:complete len:125 (+),score=14.95 TRINITY_DN10049_c0_g1_i1:120-494(+)